MASTTRNKGAPITFRPNKDDEEVLETLVEKTGLSPSELSRRALKLFLQRVEEEGGISFIFETTSRPPRHDPSAAMLVREDPPEKPVRSYSKRPQ